ncbi:MAG: PHP domain-containing protein, partial [Candidatus Aenigmatarchaeota archaeon]
MKSRYDIHVHTDVSDGKHAPEEVLEKAKERGIEVVSITDHGKLEGTVQAFQNSNGIEVIPGMEFTAGIANEMFHILGYFKEVPDIDFSFHEDMSFQREGEIYRKITDYTGFGNRIWKKEVEQARNILEEIDRNNGVSVLAHPNELNLSGRGLDRFVGKLEGFGLDGIEIYNAKHDRDNAKLYNRLADKHDLLRTSGTDFHGHFNELGENMMEEKMLKN